MSREFQNLNPVLEHADEVLQVGQEILPGPEADDVRQSRNLREHAVHAIEGYHAWAEKYPFAATAVETAVVFAAKKAAAFAGDKIGVNVRNAFGEDNLEAARRHPIKAAAQAVVLAPIAEELQYRGPSWLRRHTGNRQSSRVLDCVMALGFAAGHAGIIKPAEEWTKPPFVKVNTENLSVPAVPLMGGIHYELLSRRRGFGHAVLGHAINNALEGFQAIPEVRRRRRK